MVAICSQVVREKESQHAVMHRENRKFTKKADKGNINIENKRKDDILLLKTKNDKKEKGDLAEKHFQDGTSSISKKHGKAEKNDDGNSNMQEGKKEMRKQHLKSRNKTILIYTSIFSRKEWHNLPKNKLNNYLQNIKCKYNNCRITYKKSLFPIADAVIFHEPDMPSVETLRELTYSGNRSQNQRWIFFTLETPKLAKSGAKTYNSFFNWTMTYRLDSDIFVPYLQSKKLNKYDSRPDPNTNYAKNKKRKIAWVVSNCNFGMRMDIVHALEKLVDIYVGGRCKHLFQKKIICPNFCNVFTYEYKFYLALENGICTDYITEKYWKNLGDGLVPIVFGGGNYSDPRFAIPGSYIDILSFDSVEHLANYINYLDKNDTAYNEYFKWKQHYEINHSLHGQFPFERHFLCKICEKLEEDLPEKVYYNLSDFYNKYTDCDIHEERTLKMPIMMSLKGNFTKNFVN